MNFDQKNISYFFIGFFLFLIFLFFSFNTSRQELNQNFLNSISTYSTWFSEFGTWITKLDDNSSFEFKNILFKDSLLNSVYLNSAKSKNDLKSKIVWNQQIFDIWEGIFLFDLNDPSLNYKINWNWFSANLLSIWKVFIDNRNSKNIEIFPLTSTLNISLLDSWNKFSLTNLYLYPHMNFVFDISRNSYLKKADLYRISSIDKVSYIKENIFTSDMKFNSEFENKFLNFADSVKKDFFILSMNFANLDKNTVRKNYNTIKNSSIYNFSWISYIQNYFGLLLNNEKKSIYYKNIILEQLKTLFLSDDDSLIASISDNMNLLNEISPEDYLEMSAIVKWFYKQLSYYDDAEDYNSELNFYKLISKLSSKNEEKDLELFLYLNTFYSSYDSNMNKNTFYSYYNDYINNYLLKNLWVEKDKNWDFSFKNRNLKQNLETIKLLDYFSFLLHNILVSSFNLEDLDRNNILLVTNQYVLINNFIIKIMWDDKRTLSQIYYNNEISKKMLDNFKEIYFTWDRDENKLLVLKEWVLNLNFTINQFNLMNSIFVNIDKFYKKNYSYLDTNNSTSDRLIDNSYKEINSTYDEYILAAKDYESYKLQYDETNKNVLSTKTVADSNSEVLLNQTNFENYIKQFNSIDYSQMIFKIVENHYEIKKIFISWIQIDFDLYPRELNRITKIYLNWEKIDVSYKLDNIEENYEEQYKNAVDEEEKEKYDFKNFFINTFINKQIIEKEYYENENKSEVLEDKAIIIIKKDKLLWDKWEFSIISDIFPIKYENINVVKTGNTYDIGISWVNMTFPIDDEWTSNQNIMLEFSSKYIFTDTEHKFINISVKFLDENVFTMTWDKNYLFDAKSFDLPYNLDIKYFAERIKPAIRKIYQKANSN